MGRKIQVSLSSEWLVGQLLVDSLNLNLMGRTIQAPSSLEWLVGQLSVDFLNLSQMGRTIQTSSSLEWLVEHRHPCHLQYSASDAPSSSQLFCSFYLGQHNRFHRL